jgi:hypothetical protein
VRIKIDENLPDDLALLLRTAEYDVATVEDDDTAVDAVVRLLDGRQDRDAAVSYYGRTIAEALVTHGCLDAPGARRRANTVVLRASLHVDWAREDASRDSRCLRAVTVAELLALADDGHGGLRWTWRSLDDQRTERVAEMIRDRMTHRQIAADLGIGVASVSRHRRQAIEGGLLDG